MEKLGTGLLELRTEMHDELIHASILLVAPKREIRMGARERVGSHNRAHRRRESINLAPDSTITTVELVDCVIPLLEPTECLVAGVELCLTRAIVSASEVVPHVSGSG